MEIEYNHDCCWTIERFSLRYAYFAIIDTKDYLADQLFIRPKVRVWFGREFMHPESRYAVIMCKCKKRDVNAFLSAIAELPNKMLLCGNTDYLSYCKDLRTRIERRCRGNEAVCPSE